MKVSCRLSWRSCAIWPRVWCAAGRTLKDEKGGIGLRGPGETQLETDHHLLRNRICNPLAS
ncbi:hypothetical protein ACNKHQ_25205 [Shigella flexneri]